MNLILLGASGSIGTQTLEILKNEKNKWILEGFSIGKQILKIDEILLNFNSVKYICVRFKKDYLVYKKKYPYIKFYYGDKGLIKLIKNSSKNSYVLNALIGFSGLLPSVYSIKNRHTLLLANKESLVIGGELINKLLKKYNNEIIPIDSEHVALKKCLYNEDIDNIKNAYITASGGPFFNYSVEELKKVTVHDALNHPNWKMGKKITIDSATMMNKCFEIIEASYLFPFLKKINVLVSRDSMVHGLIEYKNYTKLNVSPPSMKGPIEYALNLGKPTNGNEFNDVIIDSLDKYNLLKLDENRFSLIKYSRLILNKKGNSGAILNAINEICVEAFLNNEITFIEIEQIINIIMKDAKFNRFCSYFNYKLTDFKYRKITRKLIRRIKCK